MVDAGEWLVVIDESMPNGKVKFASEVAISFPAYLLSDCIFGSSHITTCFCPDINHLDI